MKGSACVCVGASANTPMMLCHLPCFCVCARVGVCVHRLGENEGINEGLCYV